MRRCTVFDGLSSLEMLDLRLSPTSLSLAASLPPPVFSHHVSVLEDPLPDPEPAPGHNPAGPPPPKSGPIVPGSV